MGLASALVASLVAAPPWTWHAPPDCPAGDAVREEIEQHLGAPLDSLPADTWSVAGTVTHDDALGYAVALLIETPDGRHDRLLIEPESCQALSNSAALLIALALAQDPSEPEPPEPEPEPEPQPEPTPEPAPEPKKEPEPTLEIVADPDPPPPAPESLVFGLSLAPGFDWGTLRGVTPYGQLSLAWQGRHLRVAVSGQYGANRPFDFPPVSVPVRLSRWGLAAEVGPVPSLGSFEFPLMVGVEAGQVLLTPGALVPSAPQVAWAAILLTPGVSWAPLRWLAVTARAGTTIGLVQPSFTVQGFDPILVSSRIGVRASLGLEFRVPLVMKTGGGGN